MEIKPYFPKPLCPHGERRELLVGYGSIGSIDVRAGTVGQDIEVLGHHSCRAEESLYASQPSLPARPPNEVSSENLESEPCLSSKKRRKIHFERLCHLLGPLRGQFTRSRAGFREQARLVLSRLEAAPSSAASASKPGQLEGKSGSHHSQTRATPPPDSEREDNSEDSDGDLPDDDDGSVPASLNLSFIGRSKPQNLINLCHGYIGHSYNSDMINSEFCGGCLRYQRARESVDDFVAFPSGLEMEVLNIIDVSEENGKMTMGRTGFVSTMENRILEIDTSWTRNSGFCVVRCSQQCYRFVCDKKVGPDLQHNWSMVNTVDWEKEERPTSIALSPYISGEACVVTTRGVLYLWHPDGRLEEVQAGLAPRFTCDDTWWQCHYGAHPRALIMSDRTGVALLDLRRPVGSSSRDVDIFALPHKSLHKDERVMVTKRHPSVPFFHILATHYSIILLDERFANHPVLFWSHTMICPPQYIDIVEDTLSNCKDDILLVSNQGHSETVAYQFNIKNHNRPPQSTSTPWRISCIDDFVHLMTQEGIGPDSQLVSRKVSIPLAGVCGIVLRKSHGMSVLQITSHGDMFCQDFKSSSGQELLHSDKAACAGPGSRRVKLEASSLKVCTEWLEEAMKQIQKAELQKQAPPYKTWNASTLVSAMSCQTYPHILCPLCMPGTRSRPDTRDPPAEHCTACGFSLKQSTALQQCRKEDRVVANISDNPLALPASLFDVDTAKYSNALSGILVKLWAGETDNLTDLLKQLEEERKSDSTQKAAGVTEPGADTQDSDHRDSEMILSPDGGTPQDSSGTTQNSKGTTQDSTSGGIRPGDDTLLSLTKSKTNSPVFSPAISRTNSPVFSPAISRTNSPVLPSSPTKSRCGSVSSRDSQYSVISQSQGFLTTPNRVRRHSALQTASRSPFGARSNGRSGVKESKSPHSPFSFLSSQTLPSTQRQNSASVKKKKKRKLVDGF